MFHQFAARHLGAFFCRTQVDVDFRARAAGSRVAHFPKIVMLVAVDDMVFRQELFPVAGCFVVAFQTFFRTAFKDGGIEIGRVYFEHVDQVFPCPADGFFLEIVTKRPVAQHFEHRMVVGVMSDFFQVIVLAAHAEALLGVCHTFVFGRVVAQDDVFELVHAGIGEHQSRVVFDDHRS